MGKKTNRSITCSRYMGGTEQKLCVASVYAIMYSLNLLLTLIRVNEGMLVENENQKEYLLCLFQEIEHRKTFNLTLLGYKDNNRYSGNPVLVVDNTIERNLSVKIQKPTSGEIETIVPVIFISLKEHKPERESSKEESRK